MNLPASWSLNATTRKYPPQPLATMSDTAAQRPGSLRSVASNSSIASGVSLARRQRTRLRSKTLTGNSDEPPLSPTSELPYLGTSLVQEPLQASELFPEAQQFSVPPHLQHRLEVENDLHLRGSSASNSELSEQVTAEATFVDVQQLSVTSIKPVCLANTSNTSILIHSRSLIHSNSHPISQRQLHTNLPHLLSPETPRPHLMYEIQCQHISQELLRLSTLHRHLLLLEQNHPSRRTL